MQTLSLFPNLLTFVLVAPALLRITVGFIGIVMAWSVFKKSENKIYKWSSLVYFITSFFLIIGLYTQGFALAGVALLVLDNYFSRNQTSTPEKKILQIVLAVILISLLFTGPGFLAIDLPL